MFLFVSLLEILTAIVINHTCGQAAAIGAAFTQRRGKLIQSFRAPQTPGTPDLDSPCRNVYKTAFLGDAMLKAVWCKLAHRRHWWTRIPGFATACDKCGREWRDMNGPSATNTGTIPVFVINLKESVSRREHMKRELAKVQIPFTLIPAVSGKEVAETRGMVSRNQTACALSHLHVLSLIAEGQEDFGAIFEDDIDVLPEARHFLETATLRLLPRFDVMQLFNCGTRSALSINLARIGADHRYDICARSRPFMGTQALIYHKTAAQRIVRAMTEISAPIDELLFAKTRAFGLRVVSVRPGVVDFTDFPSTIATPGPKARNRPVRELIRGANCLRRAASFAVAWSR
jgi:glycosyl transferase family 25